MRAVDKGVSANADRAAGLRPQPPAASSQSSVPDAATPLPWRIARWTKLEAGIVAAKRLPDGQNQHVAGALLNADARFAVRAANAFPAMLAALEECRDVFALAEYDGAIYRRIVAAIAHARGDA